MLNAVTHIHSCELPHATALLCCWPECCSTAAAQGVGCLSHLDRSCWETGGRMLFMSLPVKISLHSSCRVFPPPPLRLVPTMCTKGHVESLLFFGGGGLSCGSRDWITLCSFQALEEINWTGIWYPISAGGIWLSRLISTIVHVHKDKWRISACHVL